MMKSNIASLGLFLVLCLCSGQLLAQDVTAPTITSALADPNSIDVTSSGQSVTLTVTATDDLSGIRVPGSDTRIIWRSPSNQVVQCSLFLASGTQLDAVMQATCSFPQFSDTGEWVVDVLVQDNSGNFTGERFTGLLNVVGGSDSSPPVITSAVASPSTIDLSLSGQSVTLSVTATDDLSGIRVPGPDTRIIWRSPSNQVVQCSFFLVSGTQLDATLQATCGFPQFAESGDWVVDVIMQDNAGNFTGGRFTGLLTVVGETDSTPPTIGSAFATPAAIDISSNSQLVTLTLTATDDVSGIRVPGSDTRIIWRSPSNQVVQCHFFLASGTQLDAVMQARCSFPQFSETGDWVVDVIVEDNAGNFTGNRFTGLLTVVATPLPQFALEDKVTALDASNGDTFGYAVALKGRTALVSAIGDDDSALSTGSVYVFRSDGAIWAEEAKLTADDAAQFDAFGVSVALSANRALVGASGNDEGALTDAGSAYVFRFDGTDWLQEAKLTASDAAAGDIFGHSVAIVGDTALIGAPRDDDHGDSSGSAYVFRFDDTTGLWEQEAKLTASDAAAFAEFGVAVAMSGNRVLVGARADNGAATGSGSAYVFRFEPESGWVEESKLIPAGGQGGALFGDSVALSGDRAVIGARLDNDRGTHAGAAYVFRFDEPSGEWQQEVKLVASDGRAESQFGSSVALAGDLALVGNPNGDGNQTDSGSAYVFGLIDGQGWVEVSKINAPDGEAFDRFGISVDLSGARALIGAFGDRENGPSSGSAYVFFDPAALSDIDGDGVADVDDPCPADPLDECDPQGSAAQEISSGDGGTIETTDGGLMIDVPPGSLEGDTTVSVTATETTPNDPPVDVQLSSGKGVGQVIAEYDFQPDGTTFDPPAEVTITADVSALSQQQQDNLTIYQFDPDSGNYQPDPTSSCQVDPTTQVATCTVLLSHFSTYALLAPADSDGDGVLDLFPPQQDFCPLTPQTDTTSDYQGDLLVAIDGSGAATVRFAAQLFDSAGSPVTGETVELLVTNSQGQIVFVNDPALTCQVTTDAAGVGECTLAGLPPDVYSASVSFPEVAGCYGSSQAEALVVVFDPSQPRATGGGFILPDAESTRPAESSRDKAHFGFIVEINQQSEADGNLEFQYRAAGINLHSSAMEWYTTSNNRAMFQGTATINGSGLYTFRVAAVDGDQAGGAPDAFDIKIWAGTDTEADPVHRAKNDLAGGSIIIHRR
ncbi:MAG TPA: FG-GAP repeat protein [Acidobacteriota bacterium]|nr:FG-GAP repeat protein [Acidobacteriota bacterium]